jgi:hypothetical protein
MEVTSFEIESYKVSVNQTLEGNQKTIRILSPDLSHGIRFDATLLFLSKNPYQQQGSLGQVSNLGGTNFNPIGLATWFESQSFDGFYQILSSEKPVFFTFSYEKDGNLGDIVQARLSTNSEQPGDFEKPLTIVKFPPLG